MPNTRRSATDTADRSGARDAPRPAAAAVDPAPFDPAPASPRPSLDLRTMLGQKHWPVLDGLRAVAVLTVIAYHFGYPAPGDLGVDVFFVLSGFLITTLLGREFQRTGRVSYRQFVLRRTLRIFPAYYTFVAVLVAYGVLRHRTQPTALYGAALTYTVNYYNAFHNHEGGPFAHAWSLAVEEQFYLLWPLAFLFVMRRGAATVRAALLVAIAAVFVWRSYLYVRVGVGSAYVYNAFDTRFDSLAVGCLLAVSLATRPAQPFANAVARYGWMPLVTIAVIGAVRFAGATFSVWQYTGGMTLYALLLAVLLLQLLLLGTHPLWRWLSHPVMRYLGLVSYAMYLYHALALHTADTLTRAQPSVVRFAAGVALTVAAASGSYYLIERPFLRLKDRLTPVRRNAGVARPATLVTQVADG